MKGEERFIIIQITDIFFFHSGNFFSTAVNALLKQQRMAWLYYRLSQDKLIPVANLVLIVVKLI